MFKTLLLLMLVASVVPILMVGGLSVSDTRELLIRDAQELAQERVKQVALKTQSLLEEPAGAAMGLARIPGFFSLPLSEQRAHISAVLNQRRAVTALTVFNRDRQRIPGLQAFSVKDISPTEVAEHEARAQSLMKELEGRRFSQAYPGAARKEPALTLAFSVGDPAKGYVAVEISLADLRALLSQEKVGSSGFAYVTDWRGHLVAGPPALGERDTGADLSSRAAVAHLLTTLADSRRPEVFRVGNFGEGKDRVVAAYSTLPEVGWAVFSEQPIALAYKQVSSMERRMGLGALAAIAVAAALAWLFSRGVTRPLKNFNAGALEIAQGHFGGEVKVTQKNELGELAQTFNYMSKQLGAYDQENRRLYESLERGYLETIVALANSIDSKDSYTRGHSQRVGDVAVEIGREIGLTDRELKQLHYGGILHDIGKLGIVESILCKQSRLTEEEMAVMRDHPAIGDSIIQPVTFLEPVRAAVRHHHENWDGTGYPDKLSGENIPLVARIVACADVFDACTSTRPYQKAMPLEQAMAVLSQQRGTRLDPTVLDALRRVVEKRGLRVEGRAERVRLAS